MRGLGPDGGITGRELCPAVPTQRGIGRVPREEIDMEERMVCGPLCDAKMLRRACI